MRSSGKRTSGRPCFSPTGRAPSRTAAATSSAAAARAIAGGDFAPGEPEVIARAVYNATNRFHDPRHAAEWRAPGAEAEAEGVISLILNGIRAR